MATGRPLWLDTSKWRGSWAGRTAHGFAATVASSRTWRDSQRYRCRPPCPRPQPISTLSGHDPHYDRPLNSPCRRMVRWPFAPPPHWRRDGDSNPGYPFGAHPLSRRAPSTTRTSLRGVRRRRCEPSAGTSRQVARPPARRFQWSDVVCGGERGIRTPGTLRHT